MPTYTETQRIDIFRQAIQTLAEVIIDEYQRTLLSRSASKCQKPPHHPVDDSKKLINVDELSRYLSVPKGTIYTEVHCGKIPAKAIVKLGRSLRFDKALIDQWIDAGRCKERPY